MKKTTTTLLALMIAAGATWAQSPLHERNTTHQQRMEQLRTHRSLGQGHSSFSLKSRSAQQNAAKPTQTQSRLKAYVYAEYDGTQMEPYDSLILYWQGTHHTDDIIKNFLEEGLYPFSFSDRLFYPKVDRQYGSGYPAYATKGIDSFDYYEWSGSQYHLTGKIPCVLDGDGNMLSFIWKDSTGSGWENDYRKNHTYNAAGNITSITYQEWNGSVWENDSRTSYTYDGQGTITQQIYEQWRNSASAWEGDRKELFTYDGQGHIVRRTIQTGSTWRNKYRDSYTYTNDKRTKYIRENWDNGSAQWVLNDKTEYTYNASGMRIKDINSEWDGSAWEYRFKYSYQYDNNGNKIKEVQEEWDGAQWKYNYTYSFNYGNEVLNSMTAQSWEDTSASFENSGRILFTYNTYKQCTGVVTESWDGSQWGYHNSYSDRKLAFYYEAFDDGNETSIEANNISETALKIFPNPTSDKLTVQLAEGTMNHIQITNAAGQLVFKSKMVVNTHQVTLPVSQLTPGVYFVNVQCGKTNLTKSFVVQ